MPIVFVVTALALALSQGQAPFTGMWTAEFGGHTFVRLQLATRDGSIQGALGIGDIHVDSEGAVDRAQEVPEKSVAISNAAAKDSTLSFSCQNGDDVDRFQLEIVDADHADLRFLLSDQERAELAANGVPVPKPIRLTRMP